MPKIKTIKMPKTRNPFAVGAWLRTGAGTHPDRKKQEDRTRCRQKVTEEQ